MEAYEAIVIGGGPAGLSAALYLARYDRTAALFDAGQGRSTWHQVNHNYLGFPGGIPAKQLRGRGYEQLADYPHVTIHRHKVESLERDGDLFIASGQAGAWTARAVILCTGVIDHYPHFDGWDDYVGRSLFWCITCDGYACKGQKVARPTADKPYHSRYAISRTIVLGRFRVRAWLCAWASGVIRCVVGPAYDDAEDD